MPKKDFFFILNPAARGGKNAVTLDQLITWIRKNIPHAVVHKTQKWGHGIELAKQAAQQGFQNCVVVGGDGSLNEVINGIASFPPKKRPKVGVLSMGTGGDFIRSLTEEFDLPAGWEWLLSADSTPVDLGFAELSLYPSGTLNRYFINIADVGLGGEVVRLVNQGKKRLGALEYPLATLKAAWNYQAPKVQLKGFNSVSCPESEQLPLLFLIIANGRYFGGGMCIAPEADLSDGQFQVLVSEKIGYGRLLRELPRVYTHQHIRHPKVHYGTGREISIMAEKKVPLAVDLDGEFFRIHAAKFKVIPGAIEMLVGKD